MNLRGSMVKREKRKLEVSQVQTIRAAGQAVPRVNAEKLGKQFGVSVSTIKAILARKTWKHL